MFVIRAIGGHSDAFPYIEMSRICGLATLESLLQIPGVFHMTRLTCILSICRTGIQAGYAKSRNHSFFGTFCISDKRNLVGGRGKSSSNDADFAGCCLSVKPEAFFKKGPWFTGSGMLLLEPDKVVMLEDIEQIWFHANDGLQTPPTLLYDPSRIGESIVSVHTGRSERVSTDVCAVALRLQKEGGKRFDFDFQVEDLTKDLVDDAWGICSKAFTFDEVASFPDGMTFIRCPICLEAHPAGFVMCAVCFAIWILSSMLPPLRRWR